MVEEFAALIVSGGPAHDFDATSTGLANLLTDHGTLARITTNVEHAFLSLVDPAEPGVDLVVVNALRWRMLAERYEPERAEHALSLTPAARAAFLTWLRQGGRLLAMHTAVICFDDWPEWGDTLGAAWEWGHSSHPPHGPVKVTVAPAALRLATLADAPIPASFVVHDEAYSWLDQRARFEPWLTVTADGVDQAQPAMWTHTIGDGQIVVDTLGHDLESIQHSEHRRWLAAGLHWLLHDSIVDIPTKRHAQSDAIAEGKNHASI